MRVNNYLKAKIQQVLESKSSRTSLQMLKYTFVGGFSFLIDFGTLIILTEYFHVHYLVSAGIAYLLGLFVNYFLSVNWVFDIRSIDNRIFELFVFTLIGLIGLALNQFFLWMFTDILMIYYVISKLVASSIVYFWNFFAKKFVLFSNQQSKR